MTADPLPQVLAKSARAGRAPESLASHSDATLRAAAALRDRVGRIAVTDATLGGDFWRVAQLAALAHDAGKVADGFQRMLAGSGPWGQRHEVLSLGFLGALVPDPALRQWVASAVVTHHRPLTGESGSIQHMYGDSDPDELRAVLGAVDERHASTFAQWLAVRAGAAGLTSGSSGTVDDVVDPAHDLLQQVLDQWELWNDDRDLGLAAVLLQGAVTLADHVSSAHTSLHTVQPVGDAFPELLRRQVGSDFHAHQRQAAQVGRHLLLRAPTGSGKTEAGLLWAAARMAEIARDTGGTPRLFFTLPYLASINAMAQRLGRNLPDGREAVGVSHSRAASYYLSTAIGDERPGGADREVAAARKAVARERATRLFRETVRVGTPYQLLRGVLAGPAHAGILVDSANSVFILDELHAYDDRRLGYILAAVRLWERLGGAVAVLSATLPNALAELLCETLDGAVTLLDAGPEQRIPRHRLRIRERHLTDPATYDEIRERLAADEAVLVVANSVAHAQEMFATLAPEVRERHGPDAATLLHSRFKRKDRTLLEERIDSRYGVRSETRQPGLVVATQVVEVSLDVDFDVLFTAAAPLEAMLQRFGRVNRLGSRPPADVVVHAPAYRVREGEEFADGVYPREPVECGWRILCRYAEEVVDEPQAVGWLDEVYATDWGQRWRQQVAKHRAAFEDAFLGFEYPYQSREDLADRFDQLFDGTEAILSEDRHRYEEALNSPVRNDGGVDRAAGRLLGEEYLIPLPYWAARLSQWDRRLNVAIVDGEYKDDRGLVAVRGPEKAAAAYRPGEVL